MAVTNVARMPAKELQQYAQTPDALFQILNTAIGRAIGIVHCAEAAMRDDTGPAVTERVSASLRLAVELLDNAHAELEEAGPSLLGKRRTATAGTL